MATITKKQLSHKIFEKFGRAIKKRTIHDAVVTVFETIMNDLVSNKTFSVKNFGTLSPYTQSPHNAFNVSTGRIRLTHKKNTIKFQAHTSFTSLIGRRSSLLRKK